MKNTDKNEIIPNNNGNLITSISFNLNAEVQTILDSSYDGIFVTDGRGIVLWANPASAHICGLPREKLIGNDVETLEKEGVFNPSVTLMVLREKKRITYYQDTGSGRKVLVTGTPVFDKNRILTRVICNSRDITELLNLREQLELTEQQAKRYQSELEALKQQKDHLPKHIIIESDQMKRLITTAIHIASKDVAILLLGESGVGKNALAQTIHDSSTRSTGPFIEINCGAIPDTLFESELFGYESGAFTGARREGKKGLIELAHQGTLFLNEVGELPLSMQAKLLTFLQEGYFTRVGGTKSTQANARIIAATNRDLEQMMMKGEFREDLYYRINVVPLTIPPLRERPEDILAQSAFYLDQFNTKYETSKTLSTEAVQVLISYLWPGNTRQLRNAIERAVVISESKAIEPADFNLAQKDNTQQTCSLKQSLEELERDLLIRAVKTHGSTYKVAAALGVSQPTVVRKAKKYRIHFKEE